MREKNNICVTIEKGKNKKSANLLKYILCDNCSSQNRTNDMAAILFLHNNIRSCVMREKKNPSICVTIEKGENKIKIHKFVEIDIM